MKLYQKILIGFVAGVIIGLIFGEAATALKPIGDLFIRFIKMIIVPLVLASLVAGASSTADIRKLGRIGGKTIGLYLITTAVAVIIGLVLANLLVPGVGLEMTVDQEFKAPENPGTIATLLNIVPTNAVEAMASANMLQIIVFALFLGTGISLVGEPAAPVRNFFEGFSRVMYRITGVVMELAPYGVLALMAWVVGSYGLDVILPLLKVIVAVYLGAVIHASVVYSSLVGFLAKMSPARFFRGILDASTVAFSTCSSAATLPVTMRCAEENLGVRKEVAAFGLPLGATINMDGTAIYEAIACVFIAQVYGISLTMGQQLTIVLTATLASIGAAGVPGAGMVMLTMVLQSVGLPLDGVLLVAGIDRILDMARTCVNVTGDGAVAVVVSSTEKD